MTYKQVFELAQQKGFSNFTDNYEGFISEPSYEANDDEILVELTLIQKWLRDEYKIDLYVSPDEGIFKRGDKSYGYTATETVWAGGYDTYEQALLEGIAEALKLI